MKQIRHLSLIALALLISTLAFAQADGPYVQHEDLSYGDAYGITLPMDVFVPTGEKNGLALVDIASGAWHSDRGKIRDHVTARVYHTFCSRGYTVFAVRPGSVEKFTADEMVAHMKQAIRLIKSRAEEYGIDPDRLGLMGASAGGHLACLTVARAEDGDATSDNALRQLDTRVAAVGVFFPPTNFLEWGEGPRIFDTIGTLLFNGGIAGRSEEEVLKKAESISPALQLKGDLPPFLIWHGDADPLVPLQQSELLVARLKELGTDVEFHIKEGGGHPWLTIPQEVAKMADWFDSKLEKK